MLKTIVAISLLSLSSGLAAQDIEAKISPLSKIARDNAQIAGGAVFCKIEKEKIDEYIDNVQIQLRIKSKDTNELVLARMDFTNSLIVASTQEPKDGCKQFRETFRNAGRQFN